MSGAELSLNSLKLASFDIFDAVTTRFKCSTCDRSSKWFCPECAIPHPEVAGKLPNVVLPMSVDVLWIPDKSNRGASTASHAVLLAPLHSRVVRFPDQMDSTYGEDSLGEETVVLYPSENALSLSELDLTTVSRVVVLDSTWGRVPAFLEDKRIAKARHVAVAPGTKTLFWRYQPASIENDSFLCTVEAVYWLFRAHFDASHSGKVEYAGEYDNLLYIFAHQHNFISQRRGENPTVLKQQISAKRKANTAKQREDSKKRAASIDDEAPTVNIVDSSK